jgi:hypothetical protein
MCPAEVALGSRFAANSPALISGCYFISLNGSMNRTEWAEQLLVV